MLRHLIAILAFVGILGSLAAQSGSPFQVPIPERLERATTVDEEGLQQWAEWKAPRCVNCAGKGKMKCLHCERMEEGDCEKCPECENTREATCRICAGTGDMPDILEVAPCPTCFGAAVSRCFICRGVGRSAVQGGGKRPTRCNCCAGAGAYECHTCDGKRFVEMPKLRPSFKEAKLADLQKMLQAVEAVMVTAKAFESTGDGRKDIKLLDKALAPGSAQLPVLKRVMKHFDDTSKKQAKGAVWTHYGEAVKANADTLKQSLDYHLRHMKRVLELSIKRAEHNQTVMDDKKK